jgi:hypothetical protein
LQCIALDDGFLRVECRASDERFYLSRLQGTRAILADDIVHGLTSRAACRHHLVKKLMCIHVMAFLLQYVVVQRNHIVGRRYLLYEQTSDQSPFASPKDRSPGAA